MTLDKYVEALRLHSNCDVSKCQNFNCNDCEFALDIENVPTDSEILKYFEELKELREKYKNVSEAYMKCNLELFRLMKAREE